MSRQRWFLLSSKGQPFQERETFSFSILRHTAARIRVFKDLLEKKFQRPITMEEVMEEFLRMAESYNFSAKSRQTSSTPDVKSSGRSVSSEQQDGLGKKLEKTPHPSASGSGSGIVREKISENPSINPENDPSMDVERYLKNKPSLCVGRYSKNNFSPCVSRHIPAAIRREIFRRYRGVCVFPNCNKPSKIFHHTQRFSLHRIHDPDTIIPLCVPHERIAHHGLIAHEEKFPSEWRILEQPDRGHPKYAVDRTVQKYRRGDKIGLY